MELGNLPYEVRTFFDFDIEDIIDMVASSGRPYSGEDITKALSPGPPGGHFAYVAQQQITDRLIGWIKGQPENEPVPNPESLVINLVVVPDLRRTGVGTFMLDHLISETKEIGVRELRGYVRPEEEAAIAFLSARGFEVDSSSSPELLTFVRHLA